MAHTIATEHTPPELVVNADQTGVNYLIMGNKTWAPRGDKQVPAIGQEEKRAFTTMVAFTASGYMLPFQAIYKGKTTLSLPSVEVRQAAEAMGILFTSRGDRHWSNLPCMIEVSDIIMQYCEKNAYNLAYQWVTKILVPYIQKTKEDMKLPARMRAVLLIDCWSVHRSEAFLNWMREKWGHLIRFHFICANCK